MIWIELEKLNQRSEKNNSTQESERKISNKRTRKEIQLYSNKLELLF